VARHIFQACPVWIYTQSNITQAKQILTECVEVIIGIAGRYKSGGSGKTKIKAICLQVFYRGDFTMVI
jgi:hypothetical protein